MPVRRNRFILLASIATLALLAAGARTAFAQQVNLTNIRNLDFGRFVAGSGGTIVLSPSGQRTSTGGVILLNSPNTGQAAFSVSRSRNGNGSSSKPVNVSLPPNGSTSLASGSNNMAVSNFVNTPGSPLSLPTGGTTLAVGATLIVAPNQAPGTYSSAFSVIVN